MAGLEDGHETAKELVLKHRDYAEEKENVVACCEEQDVGLYGAAPVDVDD